MTSIEPYRLAIPEAQLDDLRARLALTRWPEAELVDDWSQGVPLETMQALIAYWRDRYDWRRCEAQLNAWGQYTTEIDGVSIHFLHIRSPEPNALPLLMSHGWPGSVIEFSKVIGPLSNPSAHGAGGQPAFDLIIPSLPGYGFSGKPKELGWNIERITRAFITLMERLGYDRWAGQGGDWGCAITTHLAQLAPKGLIGIHLNCPLVLPPSDPSDFTPEEHRMMEDRATYMRWMSGYAMQQSSRPQTIGYSLLDSPVGQASWIYERFHDWTDHQGTVESILSMDDVLDNIMLYWLPGTGASSARLYWHSFMDLPFRPSHLPTGITIFPAETHRASKRWCEAFYTKLVHFNEVEKGGHFAAFEQPGIFVDEVRETFAKIL